MADNPFDQFDEQAKGNPFDVFDKEAPAAAPAPAPAPVVTPPTAAPQDKEAGTIEYFINSLKKGAISSAAALKALLEAGYRHCS